VDDLCKIVSVTFFVHCKVELSQKKFVQVLISLLVDDWLKNVVLIIIFYLFVNIFDDTKFENC